MAFNTLKSGDVAEINGMLERLVGFVAGLALPIRQAAEIDRMGERLRPDGGDRSGRISQNGVTDVAIVADHFPGAAHVLTIVTTETTGEVKMTDVVGMRPPIGLHLGT